MTAEIGAEVTYKDNKCEYHSKSYYCQPASQNLKPNPLANPVGGGGFPACTCKKISLVGEYSAGIIIRCDKCADVSKSTQHNSCPESTKLFSPRTRADWKTFIASAPPLKSPNWIIDITSPKNGCGGCNRHAMNSGTSEQSQWMTQDESPWWLRADAYSEGPSEDYQSGCLPTLFAPSDGEDKLTFKFSKCDFHA